MGDDLRLVVAVAAFEREDLPEARLERGDGRRVVLDVVGQRADLGGGIVELGLEAGQAFGRGLEARVETGERAGLAGGDRATDSRAPASSAARASWTAAAPRAIASPCCAAARRDRISSASPGRRCAPAISATSYSRRSTRRASSRGSIASSASAARFARQRSTASAIVGPCRPVPSERVEQVALPALVEEPLLVVLAVDLDERPDLVGEPRCGRREIVDPCTRAAAGRHLADDDERLGEPVEQCLDARGFRSVADDAGVGPGTADEPERVDEQALAGAGLAGDDVEARAGASGAGDR